jgi:hypothetical protein
LRTIGEVRDDVNDLGRKVVAHTEYCRRQAIAWDFDSIGVEFLGQLDELPPPQKNHHCEGEDAPERVLLSFLTVPLGP